MICFNDNVSIQRKIKLFLCICLRLKLFLLPHLPLASHFLLLLLSSSSLMSHTGTTNPPLPSSWQCAYCHPLSTPAASTKTEAAYTVLAPNCLARSPGSPPLPEEEEEEEEEAKGCWA